MKKLDQKLSHLVNLGATAKEVGEALASIVVPKAEGVIHPPNLPDMEIEIENKSAYQQILSSLQDAKVMDWNIRPKEAYFYKAHFKVDEKEMADFSEAEILEEMARRLLLELEKNNMVFKDVASFYENYAWGKQYYLEFYSYLGVVSDRADDYGTGEYCTCDKHTYEEHTCPYAEDVDGNSENVCTCCPYCETECGMDI